MKCRCTAATLQLFVRNVAHIELPFPLRWPSSMLPRFSVRRLRTTVSTSRKPRSQLHRASSTLNLTDRVKFASSVDDSNEIDAIVDVSPESIDALVKEVHASQLNQPHDGPVNHSPPSGATDASKKANEYATPLEDILSDLPQKKEPVFKAAWRSVTANAESATSASNSDAKPRRSASQSPAVKSDDNWEPPEREPWMIEKERIKEKYPNGYDPVKKLSPDAMAGIRALNAQQPERFTTSYLSREFQVSPEAIRRILKSKWRPSTEEESDRERRWVKRGEKIWSRWAELGAVPPTRWRRMGVGAGVKARRSNTWGDAWNGSGDAYRPDAPPQLVTTKAPTTQRPVVGRKAFDGHVW